VSGLRVAPAAYQDDKNLMMIAPQASAATTLLARRSVGKG